MNSTFFHNYFFRLSGFGPLFVILSIFTLAVIATYSLNYLEKEKGRHRYWLLYTLFSAGILICGFAGNIESFYVGWEMVGLASFFLIGFYQTNSRSLENSLLALANYKICDMFFVIAIFFHEGHHRLFAGLFLILATLAKSAQFPFSSWLYRALEGPTPSSTVFYGGLSLHLGPFLLLQNSGLWANTIELRILLGIVGLTSALYGLFVGAARSDLKTSLAFASTSQVGLIFIELALGFYNLAMWHMVGHNILRTWNYLRSGSFFDDFFIHRPSSPAGQPLSFFNLFPKKFYFHALNGFYLDRLFALIRDGGLVAFISLSFYYAAHGLEDGLIHWEFVMNFVALLIPSFFFIYYHYPLRLQFRGIFLSQILALFSVHLFYAEKIEETYLFLSLLAMVGLVFSLWPALIVWEHDDRSRGLYFLGMARNHPIRHGLYLICCISITASPGSIQFFLQESILGALWNRSHTFMICTLVCTTLNAYHFFRMGQQAFLGRRQTFDSLSAKAL